MNTLTRRLTSAICTALIATSALAANVTDKSSPTATDADSSEANTGDGASSTVDPACKQVSEDILDALIKGDYVQARQAFNSEMKKQLPEAKLQGAWESLLPRFGVPKMRGEPQGKHGDGLSVIYTPLKFEHGNLVSQVACDAKGKIAGFYVVPEMPPKPAENLKPIDY